MSNNMSIIKMDNYYAKLYVLVEVPLGKMHKIPKLNTSLIYFFGCIHADKKKLKRHHWFLKGLLLRKIKEKLLEG